MIIFAIAAALSSSAGYSSMTPDEQQVMGANMEYATGDTRKIVRSADTYNHPSIKPKKKIALRIIPQTKPVALADARGNGLANIIARVKRENGIKTKS